MQTSSVQPDQEIAILYSQRQNLSFGGLGGEYIVLLSGTYVINDFIFLYPFDYC